MANGFFLGGAADGIASANKQMLGEQTLAADTGLRTRQLDIQEKSLATAERAKETSRYDTLISDTMTTVGETIKSAREGGTPPEKILQVVRPLVDSAKQIAARTGRDPNALDAQVRALLMAPDTIKAAEHAGTAAGAGKAAAAIAEARAIEKAGAVDLLGGITNPKDKIAAEGSLRDDFTKQAQPFITQRDAKNRIDSLSDSGAGDVALVFSYMKILDPQSTVRESEFAQVAQAGGLPSMVQAAWNKMQGGGVVADRTRKAIRAEADNIYQASARQHDKLQTSFAGIAKRQKLNPDNIIIDLSPAEGNRKADAISGVTPSGIKFKVK